MMEENNVSLQEGQAYESAPKIRSILFAVFYTFCLYRNISGITYPFFVASSLLYLFYCIKKYGSTAGKGNYCIAGSMIFLGVIQCTTDSEVVIWTNRYLIWGLGLVILIRSIWMERIIKWELFGWLKNVLRVAAAGCIKGFYFFPDAWNCIKVRKGTAGDEKLANRRRIVKAVLLGILVVIPIMAVVLTLLLSADILFRNLFVRMFRFMEKWNLPDFLKNENFWNCLFMIGSSCLAVYGLGKVFFCCMDEDGQEDSEIQEEKRMPDPITGLVIVGAVGVTYLLFCFIQIFGLFLGKMSLPEGYTYAKYAREGFFQLAVLCAMNIFFVVGIAKHFELGRLMKCFLFVVSGCTYIMIASSAYKMLMYVKVYQLSFLRLTVLWALVVMAVLMSGVVYRILTERDWLVRFFFIVLLVAYCIFVAARPDYQIARYNLARQEASERTKDRQKADFRYLYYFLSADAVPAWIDYTERAEKDSYVLKATLESLQQAKEDMTFRTFNFSRYYAGKLAEKKLEEMYGASWKETDETGAPEDVDEQEPADINTESSNTESSNIESYEIPAGWQSIPADATWEFEDGSKWDAVAVDGACGTRFYAILGTTPQGERKVINDDPFHGNGGGSVWVKFAGEVGFASLTHNGGSEGELYRTDDMGQHFTCVDIPLVTEQLSNGEYFTPYDTPTDIWKDRETFFLLMEQGEDGDFYKDGKKTAAIYISSDQGKTWYYWDVV